MCTLYEFSIYLSVYEKNVLLVCSGRVSFHSISKSINVTIRRIYLEIASRWYFCLVFSLSLSRGTCALPTKHVIHFSVLIRIWASPLLCWYEHSATGLVVNVSCVIKTSCLALHGTDPSSHRRVESLPNTQ